MTAEELKQFKDDCIAEAVTEFWRQSYPVLVQMVAEMLPHQVEIYNYIKTHKIDSGNVPELLMATLKERAKDPNAPLLACLDAARKVVHEETPKTDAG